MRSLALPLLLLVAAVPSSQAAAPPTLPGARSCAIFPANNPWNERVDRLPVAADSQAMVAAIGLDAPVHPDFGSYAGYGIPYTVVGHATKKVRVRFDYADESDKGPYPLPAHPRIESGGDRHVLLVDRDSCTLYELYDATRSGSTWHAGSGAIWNLRSNHLRPNGWTSADAAGLPILPGLVRYDEVAAGAIDHALRFTASRTAARHIWPARHDAGDGGSDLPPMGLRVRLKASVDISHFGKQSRVILQALKTYGMILADNGSPWYISGASDPHFDDDDLHALGTLTGADFEVVDASPAKLRAGR
ncbi:MAG TPA: hypothetical protein VGK92_03120 [Gaiellales bacterium]|jgi:hypothetical protein